MDQACDEDASPKPAGRPCGDGSLGFKDDKLIQDRIGEMRRVKTLYAKVSGPSAHNAHLPASILSTVVLPEE